MPSFQVLVLSSLFVSFHPSLFRSHSCSTGACLLLSLSAFPLLFPLSFVRFFSGSDYSAFCSSFPLFPVSPLSGFPGARFRFRFFAFPILSCLISHAFFPGSRTRLPVCFLSPFPDSLPTAVPQVLPFCFRFRAFPLLFRFLSSPSSPPPATWPLFLPFRFLPVSASQWLLRCALSALASSAFPFLLRPVSRASFPGSRTRLPVRFLSSFPVSLPQLFHRCFPSFPLSLLFRAFPFPSGFFRPLLFRF